MLHSPPQQNCRFSTHDIPPEIHKYNIPAERHLRQNVYTTQAEYILFKMHTLTQSQHTALL